MNRPLRTSLLLMLLALHAVLGGRGGVSAICLGGGHQHEAEVVAQPCELACGHDALWPVPVPTDDHDSECDCLDVEWASADVACSPRDTVEGTLPPSDLLCCVPGDSELSGSTLSLAQRPAIFSHSLSIVGNFRLFR